jgi:hypothetical protein
MRPRRSFATRYHGPSRDRYRRVGGFRRCIRDRAERLGSTKLCRFIAKPRMSLSGRTCRTWCFVCNGHGPLSRGWALESSLYR